MLEQSPTVAEQYGYEVNLHSVKQPGTQVLLNYIRTTRYRDILLTCGRPCLFEGAFDTVGDEGERRCSLNQLLLPAMSEHEARHAKGRVIPPPVCNIEHSSADHDCPDILECFVENIGIGIRLAAL